MSSTELAQVHKQIITGAQKLIGSQQTKVIRFLYYLYVVINVCMCSPLSHSINIKFVYSQHCTVVSVYITTTMSTLNHNQ